MTHDPAIRITFDPDELIIDSFAGGGGASTGIFMATGRHPDVAINHDPEAIAMHAANHPSTKHYCQSIYQVDPADISRENKRPIGLAWFSPDCTHHSKARGGKPKEKHIRDLAWVVVHWAERAVFRGQRPRVIIVENVEEFKDWGPLLEDGQPCPIQKGFEFQRWVKALRKLGYEVKWKELRACDYGAPTIRKRLFIVARCDGVPIVWPEQSNGPGLLPYRTAAECIDWSIPCPSIFERKRPLAENTLRRIAKGIQRYVIDSPAPFIVNMAHGGRLEPIDEPFRTIATEKGGSRALVAPFITKFRTGAVGSPIDEPLHTITAGGKSARPAGSPHAMGLVSPTLIQVGYGEREGQSPRVPGLGKPLGTIVAGGGKHALVAAFLAQHNKERNGVKAGRSLATPISTITASGGQQQLVTSHLLKLYGTCPDGQPVTEPMPTIRAQGMHVGEVRAFLIKYFGTDQDPRLDEPMHTVTSKDRFGLVTVHGEEYFIADIGMRMLAPRELYRAQGFPSDYIIDFEYGGKPLTKTAQVRMCGNSVSPPNAAAVARAQFADETIAVSA